MPLLIVRVANCLVSGDQITHTSETSWVRDIVRFKCGRWVFQFRQDMKIAPAAVPGTFCDTTIVEVDGVEQNTLGRVHETLEALCWLLTFATQSRVLWYSYEFPAGSGQTYSKSVFGFANRFRPPFDLHDAASLKNFVHQTFGTYWQLNKHRKLPVIFDYLVQAERPGQPTEVCLLLIFVALEGLKDTFARSQGIPYVRGAYRKPPAKPGSVGAKFGFEELLAMMLRAVGMRRGLTQVVKLRNELIHSGLSRKPHRRQWQLYERLQDIIREYLLRLLTYRGEYFTYASQGRRTKKV